LRRQRHRILAADGAVTGVSVASAARLHSIFASEPADILRPSAGWQQRALHAERLRLETAKWAGVMKTSGIKQQ
jgi:hypothetical protein